MATEKELVLRRGALNTLNNLLQSSAWYDDTKTAYLAGAILVNAMPEIDEVPKQADGKTPISGEELKTWLNVAFTLKISDKQVKACSKCLEHFIKAKQLSINLYTFELMEKLGLKPEDSD